MAGIYRLALDVSQMLPSQVIYLDDISMFIEVAQSIEINSIHHTKFEITKKALAKFGLF